MVGSSGCSQSTSAARLTSGKMRPVEYRGQAIAQNHQDPLTLGVLRALALPPLRWPPLRQQYLRDSECFDYPARS